MTDADCVQFAIDAIAQYLLQHPDSADTVDGIHEWWIVWPHGTESILLTQAALERLEQDGVLQRSRVCHKDVWRLCTN